jgi:hypothetical protein
MDKSQKPVMYFMNDLKADLQRRLNKLRSIAFPYLFETISPISGLERLIYLNDKSPECRTFEAFINFENFDEESEYFN